MSVKQGGNTIAGGGVSNVDGVSIDTNVNDELETIGVIDNNGNAIKTWTGTLAQYSAIVTKDPNTLYNITDDMSVPQTILETLYPIGSLYETTASTCPLATLIAGSTWVEETNRVLVEKKVPTSSDQSWYNLYSDGWCEQGGTVTINRQEANTGQVTNVIFTKAYADTYYYVAPLTFINDGGNTIGLRNYKNERSTTVLGIGTYSTATIGNNYTAQWQTSGYTSTTTGHRRFRRTV